MDNLRVKPQDVAAAFKWFRAKEKSLAKGDRQFVLHKRPNIGQLYLFRYDPKFKDVLPWYDAAPIVFPFQLKGNGFIGLNMHYLPPVLRMKLFEALEKKTTGKNERKKVELSYQILQGASSLKLFEPTVHRYLFSHLQTGLGRIPTDEWKTAIKLPLADFRKKSASTVWKNSV